MRQQKEEANVVFEACNKTPTLPSLPPPIYYLINLYLCRTCHIRMGCQLRGTGSRHVTVLLWTFFHVVIAKPILISRCEGKREGINY